MLASFASVAPLASTVPAGVDLTDGLPLFALAALAWLFTYALHSTLMLGSAFVATRRMSPARAGLRERIWKFALLSAFVTASLQVGLGFEPLGGRLPLRRSVASEESRPRELAEVSAGTRSSAPRQFGVASSPIPGEAALWSTLLAKRALGKLETGTRTALESLLAGPRPDGPPDVERERVRDSDETPLAATAAETPWFARIGQWTQWAFATCVLGALGGLLLFALLWMRLNGCLRDRVELQHGALADKLRELCRRTGIRRRVRLSVAPSLGAPISMGMFRPEICVPPRVLLELSDEEQEVLLAHELAHVVRRDPLWLATCRLCEGVFFFQPLNRVARREIEDCAEFLSDAWAVRQTGLRFSLASCLTRIAEWIVGERRTLPAPAMAHGRSRLRHRVELLLDENAVLRVERRPRWLGVACTGFCAALVAVVPCVSASEEGHRFGDGGNLALLPDREGPRVPRLGGTSAESSPEKSCKEAEEACSASDVSTGKDGESSENLDLSGEFAALEDDFTELQASADALHLDDPRGLEITLELRLMRARIDRLHQLQARIDELRQALAPTAIAAPAPVSVPVREARKDASRAPKNQDSLSTQHVTHEETSK